MMTIEISGLSYFIIITIACIVIVSMVLNFIDYCGKKIFKHKLISLSEIAIIVQKELNDYFVPTRLITDKDIQSLKEKYAPFNDKIDKLKSHKYFCSSEYCDSPCHSLSLSFLGLNLKKDACNNIFHNIETLKLNASQIVEQYRSLIYKENYLAHSEMENFFKRYETEKIIVDFIFPEYAKYVVDEASLHLPAIFENIDIERHEHNKLFVKSELKKNSIYFDHVLGKYPLDPQQRESIVKLEDNCLVIASAGSGKTSTIVGKVKYLVEKQHIEPSKILLLTYTRKAANEMFERMNIEGVTSGTFHSLAYRIIAEVTGQAPYICEASVSLNIFHKLLDENKNFLHAINNYIINLQSLMKLEHEYLDAFSYFEDRKKYGIQALFPDVDGNLIFTRSEEEKRLCSMLTRLGVPFRYECDYPYNTRTPERRQYKPDFTIYFKDAQGQLQRIFLEHFAINYLGQVPSWFGEGTRGGWKAANQKYHQGIQWKRDTHRQYNTVLIETTSADFSSGLVESKLKEQLLRYGVPIKERTDEELYAMLVKRNRQLEKSVFTLIYSFVTLMKANEKNIDELLLELDNRLKSVHTFIDIRNNIILKDIIKPFFDAYEEELAKNFEIDFTDAIIQATQLCREGLWKQYDYILVDEFQDISIDRYKLLQALRSDKPKTKLYCVGDDWQSIFRFAGSDMALFYEFEKYFGYTELCKIETTYRFHQPLIDKTSDFVMKNPEQKKKSIKTPEGDTKHTYLNFVKCDSEDDGMKQKVEEIISSLPPDEEVLLLGRYNYDAISVGYTGKIENNDNRIKINIAGREVFFLSVHSAKGLEADHVILVNCNQGAYGFPSLIEDDPILDFVLSKGESYPFAEERRLFYVAMTRAKKRMYVLYDQKKPSPFISEFLLKLEIGSYLCPRCLEGKIEPIKEGTVSDGTPFRSFSCSNHEAGCDFFETRFGDLTPPGILITKDMTAQDVEQIRGRRRRSLGWGHSPIAPPASVNPDLIYNLNREQMSINEKIHELKKKMGLLYTNDN